MIKLEISLAISLFLSFPIILVFTLWMFYNYYQEDSLMQKTKDLHQCPYCTYFFFYYQETPWLCCPRCKSYITKGKEK